MLNKLDRVCSINPLILKFLAITIINQICLIYLLYSREVTLVFSQHQQQSFPKKKIQQQSYGPTVTSKPRITS